MKTLNPRVYRRFLDAYKSHDINLWGVTVENEPVEGQNPKYTFNCLNLTGPMERDFVKLNLGPTLTKAGYGKDKLQLMVYDDNTNYLKDFVKPIMEDKEAAKYVSGIAYHWYGNTPMGGFPDQFLTEVHKNYSEVFLLNTEACHLDGPELGRWDYAERYAYDIIRVCTPGTI
jgi:glucosylceramidase